MSQSQNKFALRCVNVHKSYPVERDLRLRKLLLGKSNSGQIVHALRGISMAVDRGKIVGVLGRNGAGKSTLLRVLGGVYPPSSGQVEANGQIAGLFELGGMGNPNLTGREYATRYLCLMGASRKKLPELLDDIQAFSELDEAFDQKIRTYSSGMGARLYFATATALQHEIYLIDELLSVGDEHFQTKCWQRMRKRLLGGASGVLVTHDWAAVLKLCEQAHVIEQGSFVFSGPSDQAVVSYLKIPIPEAGIARVSPDNPENYVVNTGKDAQLRFWVDILEPVPVDFAISIEMLRIGIGWEIVLLANGFPVAEQSGRYAVDVLIPALPLAPGAYSLNVFLSKRKSNPQELNIGLDSRTWTLGNGFHLQVEGETPASAVKLPFAVRKLKKNHNIEEAV